MTPVLQGFTGHVPAGCRAALPRGAAAAHPVDRMGDAPAGSARSAVREDRGHVPGGAGKRFGTDHLYAADTFIEMTPPSGDLKYLADLGRAIYDGMAKSDPQAVWVLQGWAFMNQRKFWTQPRIKAFLDAVPNDRMVVLDLFCETRPMWNKTEAFCGKPWLWCNVQNFGRTVGLGAALNRNNDGLFAARRDPKSGRLVGLGFVNEGLCYNPVAYDLMFEMAWRDEPVDLKAWIAELRPSSLRPRERRRPAGLADAARHGPQHPDPQRFGGDVRADARSGPLDGALRQRPTGRGVARSAAGRRRTGRGGHVPLRSGERRAAGAGRSREPAAPRHGQGVAGEGRRAVRNGGAAVPGTDPRPRRTAGHAPRSSCSAAGSKTPSAGARRTPSERKCEWNARRVLTLWGETLAINDYARKQWSGMLTGYYAPRWQRYLDAAAESLRSGQPFDEAKMKQELLQWTARWADRSETFPTQPRGDSVAVARKLWAKYAESFKPEPVEPDAVSLTTGKPATCSTRCRRIPRAWPTTAWPPTRTATGPPMCNAIRRLVAGRPAAADDRRPRGRRRLLRRRRGTTASPSKRRRTASSGRWSPTAATTRSLPRPTATPAASRPARCATSA